MEDVLTSAAPHTREDFAELYVAGILADAGWDIFFPRKDKGFDFIATKSLPDQVIVRPVQVKGQYPTATKGDRDAFGPRRTLSSIHPEMVIAVPYFHLGQAHSPIFTAFLPLALVGPSYEIFAAAGKLGAGIITPRRDYAPFVDSRGIALMADVHWGAINTVNHPLLLKETRP